MLVGAEHDRVAGVTKAGSSRRRHELAVSKSEICPWMAWGQARAAIKIVAGSREHDVKVYMPPLS